jgi:hypothetical protein
MFRDKVLKNFDGKKWKKKTPDLSSTVPKVLFEENILGKIDIHVQKILICIKFQKETITLRNEENCHDMLGEK